MNPATAPRLSAVTNRRTFLLGAAALGVVAACGSQNADPAAGTSTRAVETPSISTAVTSVTSAEAFEVFHTEAEWRELLTLEQYDVLRAAGTEPPFSSPLNEEHRTGVFSCAGCALDLFASTTKFDSGTGWPSFWAVLDDAVLEQSDDSLGMTRTEVLCRRCRGHLGHLFDDGPKPSGLRYCMNGVALNFRSTE